MTDYIFSLSIYNVAKELLNSVAEITNYKQFILCMLIQKVIESKTVHNKK